MKQTRLYTLTWIFSFLCAAIHMSLSAQEPRAATSDKGYTISTNEKYRHVGDDVVIKYSIAEGKKIPPKGRGWIATYPKGSTGYGDYGSQGSRWEYISNKERSGSITLKGLGEGEWFAVMIETRGGLFSREYVPISDPIDIVILPTGKPIPGDDTPAQGDPSIKLPQTDFPYGQAVDCSFENISKAGYFLAYKDFSHYPIIVPSQVIQDNLKGIYHLGTPEPGRYRLHYSEEQVPRPKDPGLVFNVGSYDLPAASGSIRIGVASDIHIMDPSLVVKDGKAFEQYLLEDRKLLKESLALTRAIVDRFLEEKPSIVLVPGDLTKDGERSSHELFVREFDRLREAGIRVLVVPGNHDVDNPDSYSFDGDKKIPVPSVSPQEFAEIYKEYGYKDAISRDESSLSYVAQPAAGLRVICIDACKYYDNKAIRRGDAIDSCVTNGRIKPETMAWIIKQADLAQKEGHQVLTMMHHNVVEHFYGQGFIAAPYMVDDFANVQQAFMDAGIRIVFTGHFHTNDIAKMKREDGAYLYDVETGSPVTYPCPYRIMELNDSRTELQVRTKYIDQIDFKGIEGPLGAYALKKIRDVIPNLVAQMVESYWPQALPMIKEQIPGQYKGLFEMMIANKTAAEIGKAVGDGLGDVAADILQLHYEGNENLKNTSLLHRRLNEGFVRALNPIVGKSLAPTVFSYVKQAGIYQMVELFIASALTDSPSLIPRKEEQVDENGNKREVVTGFDPDPLKPQVDDLYVSIKLPVVPNLYLGTEERSKAMAQVVVYPNPTTREIHLSITGSASPSLLSIMDMQGRILVTRSLPAGTTMSTYTLPEGVYVLRLTGGCDFTTRIIVNP